MATMHHDYDANASLPPHAPILGDDDVLEGVVVSNPALVFQVRLHRDELDLIEPAAVADGVTVTRYLLLAAIEKAQRHQDEHPPREG